MEMRGKFGQALVTVDAIEPTCSAQIQGFLDHPAFTNPVAIMPDTHAGKGSVIGFTMPLVADRIIPNIIGVDIGCGMLAVDTGRGELPLSLAAIDAAIRQRVPLGRQVHETPVVDMATEFPWGRVSELAQRFAASYQERFGTQLTPPSYGWEWFREQCPKWGMDETRATASLGTLGGGNHFIEFGRSARSGGIWCVIHTGSRNLGVRVAEYWQNTATKNLRSQRQQRLAAATEEIRRTCQGAEIGRRLEEVRASLGLGKGVTDDPALDWLEGEAAAGYLFDMIFAQVYAETNRHWIGRIITGILGIEAVDRVETVHNYIDFADLTIRKGAIRSYQGEPMIIPFNMRDGILMCEGKSNAAWNNSAPHGAGRVMSRMEARRQLDLAAYQSTMREAGIFSTSVSQETIDEAPDAYKPAALIEDAIAPTATILDRIRPIFNIKAAE